MKKNLLITIGIAILLFILGPGCYTQLSTVRDDDEDQPENNKTYQSDNRSNDNEYTQGDSEEIEDQNGTTVVNQYYDDWHPRYRVGFSYYYPSYYWPSVAFSYAYNDPWFYDSYWAYDPWFCGTPYVMYPAYYSPAYYYYPPTHYPYYYGYGGNNSTPDYRGGRAFGTTRTTTGHGRNGTQRTEQETVSRTDAATPELPTGGMMRGTSRTDTRDQTTPKIERRREGSRRISREGENQNPTPGRIVEPEECVPVINEGERVEKQFL